MFTGEGLIQLFVTEEEADIIRQSLGSYTGPYHEVAKLTEGEIVRQHVMVAKADAMREVIEDILTDRCNREEERRALCDMLLIYPPPLTRGKEG